MDEFITYYAVVNEFSSMERPFAVVRRVKHDGGQRDEVFSRAMKWEHTALLYSAERGDLTNDLIPITEEAANQIVSRIRETANPAE
jgi:hypothetical protein